MEEKRERVSPERTGFSEAGYANANRYIAAFARLEKTLDRITRRPEYVPFRLNARIAARYSTVVKNHLEDLVKYAELRNAIVHFRDGNDEIVAVPSLMLTEEIERLAELLEADRNILSFASSPVITATEKNSLDEMLRLLDEHRIDCLPIYSGNRFIGLLTLQDLLHFKLFGTKVMAARQILEHSHDHSVAFMDRNKDIQDVVTLMEETVRAGRNVPLILVTEHGKADEEPVGIISNKEDLGRIIAGLA